MWVLRVFFPSSYLLAVAYQHTPIIKPSHGQSPVALPIERWFSNEKKGVPAIFNLIYQTLLWYWWSHIPYPLPSPTIPYQWSYYYLRPAGQVEAFGQENGEVDQRDDHEEHLSYNGDTVGYPIAGWFRIRMERPIFKWMIWGYLPFEETSKSMLGSVVSLCFTMAMKIPWNSMIPYIRNQGIFIAIVKTTKNNCWNWGETPALIPMNFRACYLLYLVNVTLDNCPFMDDLYDFLH